MPLMPYRCPARVVYCPDDPVLRRPLYNLDATLPRREFIDSLAVAAFPAGSEWSLSAERWGEVRIWSVWANELHAVDGDTVLRAVEDAKQQVRLVEVTRCCA